MRRCKDCDKPIREPKQNKSGYCSVCGHKVWMKAYKNKRKQGVKLK